MMASVYRSCTPVGLRQALPLVLRATRYNQRRGGHDVPFFSGNLPRRTRAFPRWTRTWPLARTKYGPKAPKAGKMARISPPGPPLSANVIVIGGRADALPLLSFRPVILGKRASLGIPTRRPPGSKSVANWQTRPGSNAGYIPVSCSEDCQSAPPRQLCN
jgi:hypothetical protein